MTAEKAREIAERLKTGSPYSITNRERMRIWIEEGVTEAVAQEIESFVKRIEARAEGNMLKTGKLEGSHYAAMKVELEAIRSRTHKPAGGRSVDREQLLEQLTEARSRLEAVRDYPKKGEPRRTKDGYPAELIIDEFSYKRMIDSYRKVAVGFFEKFPTLPAETKSRPTKKSTEPRGRKR